MHLTQMWILLHVAVHMGPLLYMRHKGFMLKTPVVGGAGVDRIEVCMPVTVQSFLVLLQFFCTPFAARPGLWEHLLHVAVENEAHRCKVIPLPCRTRHFSLRPLKITRVHRSVHNKNCRKDDCQSRNEGLHNLHGY